MLQNGKIYLGLSDTDGSRVEMPLSICNRHGLIAGASGTGKTITMKVMAESFSDAGVPVFLCDIKGDVSGLCVPGEQNEGMEKRIDKFQIRDSFQYKGYPVCFWDVYGETGHPVRTTISDMGPELLSRILGLSEAQEGVLNIVFKIADDHGLLLLDLKDLRAMLQHVGDNAKQFTTQYGNISAASVGAIQRGLLQIESQGGDQFFGEPMLNIADLMQTDGAGHGVVNILAADQLMQSPRLYSTFLLWMLSELFEQLPEVGDLDQPKLAFFFDEAHLLFNDAPKVLIERIELVVRLVRSKGVGVYFVTQNPMDIPDSVLAQLGNRVQHALRAFTPKDQKAVKATAQTMRPNPGLDIEAAITELAVGEALVSFLDDKGRPGVTQRVFVIPPGSLIGPITDAQRQQLLKDSIVAGVYDTPEDRESAFEILRARTSADMAGSHPTTGNATQNAADSTSSGLMDGLNDLLFGSTGPRGGKKDGLVQSMVKSTARNMANQLGRQLVRGVLGSLMGGSKKR